MFWINESESIENNSHRKQELGSVPQSVNQNFWHMNNWRINYYYKNLSESIN